jgi:hypothetical protein
MARNEPAKVHCEKRRATVIYKAIVWWVRPPALQI